MLSQQFSLIVLVSRAKRPHFQDLSPGVNIAGRGTLNSAVVEWFPPELCEFYSLLPLVTELSSLTKGIPPEPLTV